MPRIKILKIYECKNYCGSLEDVIGETTTWEEVTQDDLDLLNQYIVEYNINSREIYKYVLVEDLLRERCDFAISTILGFARQQEEKFKKEKRKKDLINKKRQETKKKNQEEKERKILEELKAKYSE